MGLNGLAHISLCYLIGSCASATEEFKSTPSYPSSIAKMASDGFQF